MFGIVDDKGKVYASSPKSDAKFVKLLNRTREAYPTRSFNIEEVCDNPVLVGSIDKSYEFFTIQEKKGSA